VLLLLMRRIYEIRLLHELRWHDLNIFMTAGSASQVILKLLQQKFERL
jgi:hypothetical protein